MKSPASAETARVRSSILNELSNKRIYFGHMSVGNNILEGVNEMLDNQPDARISIARGDDPALFSAHTFVHSAIGRNGDPISKIDQFAEKMRSGIGKNTNIALFKFCFVDFKSDTDLQEVFSHYTRTLDTLSSEFPDTQFPHVTVPLTTLQKGPKAIVKKILGMNIGLADNYARMRFNRMILQTYADKEPVFDLAGLESTHPDGMREYRTFRGEKVYLMVPSYTYDSGHLSATGRRRVADHFLEFLASL